jgi:hypothetical protein
MAVLGSLGILSAGIRPSFYLESCTWNASDILVMVPTENKASFRVVESIKGDTPVGTVLLLDDLAPHDDAPLRPLRALVYSSDPFNVPATALTVPPIGKDDRMIAFLRRPGAMPEYNPRPDLPVTAFGWQPAAWYGGFLTSAVWLQDGAAFAFVQTMNPGPTHLVDLMWTEGKIREQIHTVLLLRDALDRALANPDPETRSKQLADLVRADRTFAQSSALRHLESGGTAATAALLDLLADQTLLGQHSAILEALVKSNPRDLDLGPMLRQETRYWTRACRTLQTGWWNSTAIQVDDTPRSHYTRVYAILRGIQQLHLTKNVPQVREFAEAWRTCPPMDKTDRRPDQISEEIDLLLNAGPRPRDP